MHGVTMKYK